MINFDNLPLSETSLKLLSKLNIDFAFQPIFNLKTNEIIAREALMRPIDLTPLDLIDTYESHGFLHVIELATFFGATMRYYERGYNEGLSINSFPTECFTQEEFSAYLNYFPSDLTSKLIIEVLEYPRFTPHIWHAKKTNINKHGIKLAVDDYGSGYNDITTIDLIQPDYIKLDRILIENIDRMPVKQQRLSSLINIFHNENIKVLAEGIETKEEYDYLINAGIDYGQGYYMARPS